jgi:hypothetical protein
MVAATNLGMGRAKCSLGSLVVAEAHSADVGLSRTRLLQRVGSISVGATCAMTSRLDSRNRLVAHDQCYGAPAAVTVLRRPLLGRTQSVRCCKGFAYDEAREGNK